MVNSLLQLKLIGRTALAVTALWSVSPLFKTGTIQADSTQNTPRVAVSAPRGERPRALLVGGGPTAEHNQVAIESNVRYLLKLLPSDSERTVLFADGDRQKETVLFEATYKPLKPGEQLLALLLTDRSDAHPSNLKYRKPSIPQIDGPSKKEAVTAAFDKLVNIPVGAPLLIYFTGHGSPGKSRDWENNAYDLWHEDTLSVRELATQVARLPAEQPVTVVMVQCFSGAFANLMFQDGDPSRPASDRDIAGFFAAIKERMAAGCTPEVNESEYHDFTSYFFAALSGRDRVGRKVTGADFNRDGKVTMDEAFCYTLINDSSIDVPVCTSDIFLRKVVLTPDAKVFETNYRDVLSWATVAQRAALEQLSTKLKLSGDDRAKNVYHEMFDPSPSSDRRNPVASAMRTFTRAKEDGRKLLFSRWPDLKDSQGSGYAAARKDALQSLDRWIQEGKFKEVMDADTALDNAEDDSYKQEIASALSLRFVRLVKSVVLAHQLRDTGESATVRRFEKLVAAEGRRPTFLDRESKVAAAP